MLADLKLYRGWLRHVTHTAGVKVAITARQHHFTRRATLPFSAKFGTAG